MKFITTFGIEYSYLFYKKNRNDESVADNLYDLIRTEFKLNPKFRQKIKSRSDGSRIWPHVDNDSGVVEIQSPIHKSMKHAKGFYDYMEEIISHYPLVTHRNDIGGGGGHIHFGIDFLYKRSKFKFGELAFNFYTNLYRDMQNRPYLNWLFNEYFDNESSNDFRKLNFRVGNISKVLFSNDSFKKMFNDHIKVDWDEGYNQSYRKSIREGTPKYKKLVRHKTQNLFSMAKGLQLIANSFYGTIEVRIFDGKRNWKEVQDHLEFLNAYIKYIFDITMGRGEIPIKVKTTKDVKWFAKNDRCIDEFLKMLRMIGLPGFDYLHYVNLNYKRRKKHGYII